MEKALVNTCISVYLDRSSAGLVLLEDKASQTPISSTVFSFCISVSFGLSLKLSCSLSLYRIFSNISLLCLLQVLYQSENSVSLGLLSPSLDRSVPHFVTPTDPPQTSLPLEWRQVATDAESIEFLKVRVCRGIFPYIDALSSRDYSMLFWK